MAPAGIGDRLEGVHAVAAAVTAGRVVRLTVESARLRDPVIGVIVAEARASGAEIVVVSDVMPEASTAAPQGLVARAHPIPPASLEEAIGATDPPAVLVLDHFEDPRNVGAAARSALAAGVAAIVVPERRAAPLSAAAFKAAAGALESIRVVPVSSIADAVRRLRAAGLWTVGLAADGEESLFGFPLLAEPVALVIGSEGRGVGRLAEKRLDAMVRIPQSPGVESLNASVAVALAVFETARVRGWVI
jgi:23S rRNA (guanosine2251-2'-O)-methyltransferase